MAATCACMTTLPSQRPTEQADTVIPLFVLDTAILRGGFNRPNRAALLAASLVELDEGLRELGGGLVVRRGDWVREVAKLARSYEVDAVFIHADVSGYAQGRLRRLGEALEVPARAGRRAAPPRYPPARCSPPAATGSRCSRPTTGPGSRRSAGARSPGAGASAAAARHRSRHCADAAGDLPQGRGLARPAGGRREGRTGQGLRSGCATGVESYEDLHDDLAADATSRLQRLPALRLRLGVRAGGARRAASKGMAAFARQLCWRDFHAQVLASTAAGRTGGLPAARRPVARRRRGVRGMGRRPHRLPHRRRRHAPAGARGLDAQPGPADHRVVPHQDASTSTGAAAPSTSPTCSSTATSPTTR